jgi:hypothetical protein
MEFEISSQDPATGPYIEPNESSPQLTLLSLIRAILILTSHLRLGLPSGLFIQVFPTKVL